MSFWPFVSEEEDQTVASNREMEEEEISRLFQSGRSYPFPRVATFEKPDIIVQKYNKMKDKSNELDGFTFEQKKTIDKIYSKLYKQCWIPNAPDTIIMIDENRIRLQWNAELVSNSIPPEYRSVLISEMIVDCSNKTKGIELILYQNNNETKHFLTLKEALNFLCFHF
jgi:hypothetical protein